MERSHGVLARALIACVFVGVAGATIATALLTQSVVWALGVLAGGLIGALTTLLAVGASGASRGDMLPALRAQIDPVTGLPREERLDQALDHDEGVPLALYRFTIEGFRSYNDAFGEACGDALLTWLARKLRDAVGHEGSVYRTRGAGFAVLTPGSPATSTALLERCTAALQEAGEGFRVACVVGAVALPDEATNARSALDLANRRAQAHRQSGRVRTGLQPAAEPAALIEVSRSTAHAEDVAVELGSALGVPADELEDLAAAVRLRDVGNVAVPGSVFARAGHLPGHEWQFIQLHTLVGERLLSASSGMDEVARLVRSSHERYDGSGYPDSLSGDLIPLGSRIVFVCSAFQDMTTARAHRAALSVDEALAELERGAGTQFDPEVVRAFREQLAHALQRRGLAVGAPEALRE
jgi:two-component system cell cycle response regulator